MLALSMPMPALALLSFVRALLQAPACAHECDALAGTDRQTCLLTCEQHERPSDSGVTTWHREDRLGGAPPGSAHEGESNTTTREQTTDARGNVTTRGDATAHGTTAAGPRPSTPTPSTTTANARSASRATSPARAATTGSAARDDWFGIASCQRECDPRDVDHERARCKLGCLRLSTRWTGSRAAKAFDARR